MVQEIDESSIVRSYIDIASNSIVILVNEQSKLIENRINQAIEFSNFEFKLVD